jgi:hypothetical protein
MSSDKSFELIYTSDFNMTAERQRVAGLTDTDPVIDHKNYKLTGITHLPEPVQNMLKSRGVVINVIENKN